jgi:hypothetical protein
VAAVALVLATVVAHTRAVAAPLFVDAAGKFVQRQPADVRSHERSQTD